MTDLIKIPKSIFYSYKEDYNSDTSDVAKKYDAVYSKFTCFTNPSVVLITKPPRKHQSNNTERKYANKDIYKIILGFLNVLNNANYAKIVNKLSLLITPETIQIIVNEILRICTIQIFYVKLYIQLLRDLLERCCSAERIIAFMCIKKYGADYFAKKEWIYKKKLANSQYADFCLLQKFKTHILAKNTLLLRLHHEFDDKLMPETYLNDLLNDLEMLPQDNITLILELLLLLTPTYKTMVSSTALTKLTAIEYTSKKNQFIVQELLKVYCA